MTGLLGVIALLAAAASAPQLEVSLTPQELTIGDRAQLVVSISLPDELPSGAVSWPNWEANLGPAEILDISPVETLQNSDGERVVRQALQVAFFEVGERIIPPLSLEIAAATGSRSLVSEEIRVAVRSVLPEGEEEPQPKPPAAPRRLALGERFWWTTVTLLATCLAALTLLTQQARRDEDLPTAPPLSPRAELEKTLSSLRSQSDPRAIYAGASMAARRYLGRTLGFAAPESTTTEVQSELRRRDLSADLVQQTGKLFSTCDMVKFARQEVDIASGRERLDDVETIAGDLDQILGSSEPADEEVA